MEPPVEHSQENPSNMCKTCNNSFKTSYALKVHQMIHSTNIICNVCGSRFTNFLYFKNHIKKNHKDYHFPCELCTLELISFQYLLKHANNHSNYPCKRCDKKYASKLALLDHNREHDKNELTCKICNNTFATRIDLNCHKLIHLENTNKHKCKYCGKFYYSEIGLRKHTYTEHKDVYATCTVCNKKFASGKELINHSYIHKEIYYECCGCPKGTYFSTQDAFELHNSDIHKKKAIFKAHVGDSFGLSEPQIHEKLQSRPGLSSSTESPDTFVTPTLDTDQSQLSESELLDQLLNLNDESKEDGKASYEPQIHKDFQSRQDPSSYTESSDTFEIFILDIIQFLISELPNLSEDICEELLAIVSELPLYSHTESVTCTECQKSLMAGDLKINTNCKLMEEHFTKTENYFMCNYCNSSFDFLLEAFHHIEGHCVEYFLQTNEF